jgi:hypothetical protein
MQTYEPDQSLLLQVPVPESVLSLTLQKLGQPDLACLAATCSRLSRSAPANITGLSVCCCSQETPHNVVRLLDQLGASIVQARIHVQRDR